jgi:hypothetical protein
MGTIAINLQSNRGKKIAAVVPKHRSRQAILLYSSDGSRFLSNKDSLTEVLLPQEAVYHTGTGR